MNPLDNPYSLSPVHTHRDLPMVKFTYEFDFYRCLAFKPHFYGVIVSELHAGNLRRSEDGRYANLWRSELRLPTPKSKASVRAPPAAAKGYQPLQHTLADLL